MKKKVLLLLARLSSVLASCSLTAQKPDTYQVGNIQMRKLSETDVVGAVTTIFKNPESPYVKGLPDDLKAELGYTKDGRPNTSKLQVKNMAYVESAITFTAEDLPKIIQNFQPYQQEPHQTQDTGEVDTDKLNDFVIRKTLAENGDYYIAYIEDPKARIVGEARFSAYHPEDVGFVYAQVALYDAPKTEVAPSKLLAGSAQPQRPNLGVNVYRLYSLKGFSFEDQNGPYLLQNDLLVSVQNGKKYQMVQQGSGGQVQNLSLALPLQLKKRFDASGSHPHYVVDHDVVEVQSWSNCSKPVNR